jgi:hypothetical protein
VTWTFWWRLDSVSITSMTVVDVISTGFTSLLVTLFTNLSNFKITEWTVTLWWVVSSSFSTSNTMSSINPIVHFNTFFTFIVTFTTSSILVTVHEVGFTRTLGWLLGSVSFTGETRSGIGASFTNVHTWLTVTVITIIIETIWTETSWGFDSVTGTRHTISRRSSTFGTFIRTWLTETVDVGLSGWTWTFWVGVS